MLLTKPYEPVIVAETPLSGPSNARPRSVDSTQLTTPGDSEPEGATRAWLTAPEAEIVSTYESRPSISAFPDSPAS